MKKTLIVICIICLAISGTMISKGYVDYKEYKKDRTYYEIGNDVIEQTEGITENIKATADLINKIKETTENVIDNIRPFVEEGIEFFKFIETAFENSLMNMFDGIVDLFTKIYNWFYPDEDFEYGGGGYGGGAGGARG